MLTTKYILIKDACYDAAQNNILELIEYNLVYETIVYFIVLTHLSWIS